MTKFLPLLALLASSAALASPINVGTAQTDPQTLESIGIVVPINSGDTNYNAVANIEYRRAGTSNWSDGLPLMRVRPEFASLSRSQEFAGSIFGLNPGTSYDVRVTVSDPDGGGGVQTLSASTRGMPRAQPANATTINVSNASEFSSALSNAQPGHVIVLQPGNYVGTFQINNSGTSSNPIFIRGADRTGSVIQGSPTSGTGSFLRIYGSYVTVENLTIENTGNVGYAVRADSRSDLRNVVIRNCNIQSDRGIRVWTGTNRNFTIYQNVLQGINNWPDISNTTWDDEGIRIVGQGHAIFENTLSGYGDSIGFHRSTDIRNRSIDIYRNKILWGGDDALELDDGERNIRAYDNLVLNSATMVSIQHNNDTGGPIYAFRNVAVNLARRPFKLNDGASGFYLLNNTAHSTIGDTQWLWSQFNNGAIQNFQLLNNLIVGSPQHQKILVFEAGTSDFNFDNNFYFPDGDFWLGPHGSHTSFDQSQSRGSPFDNNGGILGQNVFANPTSMGSDYTTRVNENQVNFRLASGSNAVNAAVALANINDGFNGSAPDVGALELGKNPPNYGADSGNLPTINLSADPETVTSGSSSVLTWSTGNANSCNASGGWSGSKGTNGNESVGPLTQTQTFTLSCSNADGSTSRSVTVNVQSAAPAPTVSISADPTSITSGQTSTLSWSSTNANSCSASGGWSGSKGTSGNQSVGPTSNQTYTLTCTGDGGSASDSVTVTVDSAPPPDAPTVNFSADPSSITSGQSSTLSWSTNNANSCSASGGWSGNKGTSGSQSVSPSSSRTYSLTCTGDGGSTTESVTVTVDGAVETPTVNLSASTTLITVGQTPTLTWSSNNANSCSASGGWSGNKATSGSQLVGPTQTRTYTLTCSGPGGNASDSVTITVEAGAPAPTINLSANPTSITDGESSTLSWSTNNADSCSAANGWSGNKGTSGNESVSPSSSNTYSLTCTGEGGSTTESVTVTVDGVVDAPTVSLTGNPTTITAGETPTLTWSSSNANSCSASGGWQGNKGTSGSQFVGPTETRDYTLTCTGPGGSASDTVTITVESTPPPPNVPTVNLSANPTQVSSGDSSTLSWSTSNADSCSAQGAWNGNKGTVGSESTGALTSDSTFTLNCTGPGGSASASVTVDVETTAGESSLSLTANPISVASNGSSTLSWTSENVSNCVASGDWDGGKPTSGTETVGPLTSDSTFSLSCDAASGGSISDSVTVTIDTVVTTSSPPDRPQLQDPGLVALRDWSLDSQSYTDPDGDSLMESEWQISSDQSFSDLLLDRIVPNQTSLLLALGTLEPNATYWVRTRHRDTTAQTSPWSQALSFNTVATYPNDTDGDGVDDAYQVTNGDANQNGTPDSEEGICNLLDAEGGSVIGFQTNLGDVQCLTSYGNSQLPAGSQPQDGLDYGMFAFVVENLPVDANNPARVEITIFFPEAIPSGSAWHKYDEATNTVSNYSAAVFDGNTSVVLTLTDGGVGDADGLVNGRIVDPSGVAAADSTTTGGGGGGEGGGPAAGDDSGGGPIGQLLLSLIVLLQLRRLHLARRVLA